MKKILIAETNIDSYGSSAKQTGIWLEEITSFYEVVTKAGYSVDFGSAKGGRVPVDPASANADPETMRIYADPAFHRAAIEQTRKFSDLHAKDYAAIYFGGGHGAMWDFPDNTDLQKLAEGIYENGGFITSVCHGEAGLLNLKDRDGNYLVQGKKINGFTDEEERMNGTDSLVPFLGESALRKHGASFVKGDPFTEFTISDARMITGQNPFSSKKVAERLVEELGQTQL
ncbi:MAG: type 1 glutamine amidotransferase domain-containing protein [Eubacterium sp.]|nr:type 1 glutamine amidotransferase domain-containing protein [Eubacterium sp.]